MSEVKTLKQARALIEQLKWSLSDRDEKAKNKRVELEHDFKRECTNNKIESLKTAAGHLKGKLAESEARAEHYRKGMHDEQEKSEKLRATIKRVKQSRISKIVYRSEFDRLIRDRDRAQEELLCAKSKIDSLCAIGKKQAEHLDIQLGIIEAQAEALKGWSNDQK